MHPCNAISSPLLPSCCAQLHNDAGTLPFSWRSASSWCEKRARSVPSLPSHLVRQAPQSHRGQDLSRLVELQLNLNSSTENSTFGTHLSQRKPTLNPDLPYERLVLLFGTADSALYN